MRRGIFLSLIAALALASPASAGEHDPSLTEFVKLLRDEGVIDAAQHNRLAAWATEKQAKRSGSWADRFRLYGDFRARLESWYYQHDAAGVSLPARHRGRYRIRLGGEALVNDHAKVKFRIGTGGHDPRNSNNTMGGAADSNSVSSAIGLDFDSDPILIDRAFLELTPLAGGALPSGREGWMGFQVGKVPNPYTWAYGKDLMLWDGDINLEGLNFQLKTQLSENLEGFVNSGYYIIDENSTSKDPEMAAVQFGGHLDLLEDLKAGARFSYYHFGELNSAFETRSAGGAPTVTGGGGTLVGGLSGSPSGDDFGVIETGAYLRSAAIERLPVLLFGTYSYNLDAERVMGAGREAESWSVGAEVGDKKQLVKLGTMYGRLEANSFPGLFTDSDMFDAFTNRKGFAFYGVRQLMPGLDFGATAFWVGDIKDGAPFASSNADRVRVQIDLMAKF